MKKSVFISCITLLALLCAFACADTVIPLTDQNGNKPYIRCIAMVNDITYFLLDGKRLCVINAEYQPKYFPLINLNPEYEEVSQALLKRCGIPEGMNAPDWCIQFSEGINRLIGGGKELYALNDFTGTLYRLTVSNGQATLNASCILDFAFDNLSGNEVFVQQALIVNGELYVVLNEKLYCFHQETGKRSEAKSYSLLDIQPYRDGQMLLLEEINGFDRAVTAYDPGTGKRTKIDTGATKEIDQLLYDRANDRILLYAGSKIIALTENGTQITVGYWPSQDYGAELTILDDGTMAVYNGDLHIVDVRNEVPAQTMLMITSSYFSMDEYDFIKQHPEILFTRIVMSPDEILQLFSKEMNLRSSTYDVYEIPLGPSLDNILSKGYFMPLEALPEVSKLVQSSHPFLAEMVLTNGHIGALPVHLRNETVSCSQYALAQLHIDPSEIPGTYEDFLAFCLTFNETYGDMARDKGITLFADEWSSSGISASDSLFYISSSLANRIVQCYYSMMYSDAQLALNREAELAKLLNMLKVLRNMGSVETMVGEAYEPPEREGHNPPKRYHVNDEPNYLFTVTGSVLPDSRHYSIMELLDDFVPIPFSLFEGMKPHLYLNGSALIINPYCANAEEAKTFLSYCAAKFPADKSASFSLEAKPVEERDYGHLLRMYSNTIADYEERLKYIEDEAEKKEIRYQIELNQAEIASLDHVKWAVRQEWIDEYQQTLSQTELVWPYDTVLGESAKKLLWQLLQGTMDGDTCAREVVSLFQKAISENAD